MRKHIQNENQNVKTSQDNLNLTVGSVESSQKEGVLPKIYPK
jgi:hypothetical protein